MSTNVTEFIEELDVGSFKEKLGAFGKIAEKVRGKGKGAFIRVTARYKTDKWQDQYGNNKTAIYFIVDDFEALTFDKVNNQSEQSPEQTPAPAQAQAQAQAQQNEFIDNEIPF